MDGEGKIPLLAQVQEVVLSITWKSEWEMFRQWVLWHCPPLLRAGVTAKGEDAVLISSVTLITFVLNQFLICSCPAGSKKWVRRASRRYYFRNKSRKPYFKPCLLSLFSNSSRMKFLFGPFSFQQNSSPAHSEHQSIFLSWPSLSFPKKYVQSGVLTGSVL